MKVVLTGALLFAAGCAHWSPAPYHRAALEAPELQVGAVVAEANDNSVKVESAIGHRVRRYTGRIAAIGAFNVEGQGRTTSACSTFGTTTICSASNRRGRVARLSYVTLEPTEPGDNYHGILVCAFEEQAFDDASRYHKGEIATIGGVLTEIRHDSALGAVVSAVDCLTPY